MKYQVVYLQTLSYPANPNGFKTTYAYESKPFSSICEAQNYRKAWMLRMSKENSIRLELLNDLFQVAEFKED